MDAFFASVEQRDNPEYRGKPLVVGGNGPRSVIAAASYEARKYKVRSAMPTAQALQLCPHLLIVPHRFNVYKDVSKQIRGIFHEYTDLVEPLSLDEAYLDVTENKINHKSAIYIASEIKRKIKQLTQLTASAGVSNSKFVAKVASGMNKPDGLTVILPEEVEDFVSNLPINKFFGVGKATLKKMHKQNIRFGRDLLEFDEIALVQKFGKMGRYFYKVSRGVDDRPVNSERVRKSISSENTYSKDLHENSEILKHLEKLTEDVVRSIEKIQTKAQTVQVKVRYRDFETLTRQKTVSGWLTSKDDIWPIVKEIIDSIDTMGKPIRLLGVGVAKLEQPEQSSQLTIPF